MKGKLLMFVLALSTALSSMSISFAATSANIYEKYYDDSGIKFIASPQSAPWDFSVLSKDGLASVKMPLKNHPNQVANITPASGGKAFNFEPVKRAGVLSFKVFVESDSYNAQTDRLAVRLRNDGGKGWTSTDTVYLPQNLQTEKWVDVNLPLSSFGCYDTVDYGDIKIIEMRRSGYTESEFNVYLAQLEVRCAENLSLTACENDGAVTLKWWCAQEAGKFKIYKNGTLIATVTDGTQYTYTPSDDKKSTYSVKAYTGSRLIAQSKEVYPDVDAVAVSTYEKQAFFEGRLQKYAVGSAIVRVGSSEGYFNNYRRAVDPKNLNAAPFESDGSIYIPLELSCKALGAKVQSNSGGSVSVEFAGSTFAFDDSSSGIRRKNGVLFADGAYLAQALGVHYNSYGDLAVLSAQSAVMSDYAAEEISETLSLNKKNAYLGSLGYITGAYSNPKNPNKIYCKTDVGGIYLYDRERDVWEPLMESIPQKHSSVMAVRSMALDPNNEDTIYVSGGGNWYEYPHYLLKTTNGGETWQRLNFSGNTAAGGEVRLMGESIAVDANNSNVVYCGTFTDGLYISTDGGTSWQQISDIPAEYNSAYPGGIASVLIDSSEKAANGRSKRVYVSVLGRGLYESNDGGESFSIIKSSPLMIGRMQLAGGKLYLTATDDEAGNTTGGYFSYSEGVFTDLSPDAACKHYMAFLVNRYDPNMMIVVGAPYRSNASKHVFRTYDGGITWEALSAIRNPTCILQDTVDGNGIWWPYGAGMYYVKNMYAPTLNYKSCDTGIEELVCTQVVSVPTKSGGSVLHTMVMDHGHMVSQNIHEKASVMKPYVAKGAGIDYCDEDSNYVFRTGYTDNDYLTASSAAVSTDGGNSFTDIGWQENNRIVDSAMSSQKQSNGKPLLMIASIGDESGNGAGIWRSKNYGAAWEKCADLTQNLINWSYTQLMLDSDRVDGNVFYWQNGEELYRTKDGGDSWQLIKTFEKINSSSKYSTAFIKTVPDKKGALWVRRTDGIYTTYDFGDTWSRMAFDEVCAFGFGKGESAGTPAVYLLGIVNGEYGLYISDDLGVNWRMIANSSNDIPEVVTDICGDAAIYGRAFAATGGKGVYAFSPVDFDDERPTISAELIQPVSPYASAAKVFSVSGSLSESGKVFVNGIQAQIDSYNNFSADFNLGDGINKFTVTAEDEAGNAAEGITVSVRHIPDLYEAFYNNLNSADTLVSTYVHTGSTWDAEANKKMSFVYSDAVSGMLDGEYAIKMELANTKGRSYQINRINQNYINLEPIKKTGVLHFKVYIDTDSAQTDKTAENAQFRMTNDGSNGWRSSKAVSLPGSITADGKWHDVTVPISQLDTDGFDWSKLYGMTFSRTEKASGKWDLYVKDIYFAETQTFGDVVITDESGNNANSVSAGGTYTASVDFFNSLGESVSPVFITAIYDGTVLADVKVCDAVTVKPGQKYTFVSDKITVGKDAKKPIVKVFMWKDFESLYPYMKAE